MQPAAAGFSDARQFDGRGRLHRAMLWMWGRRSPRRLLIAVGRRRAVANWHDIGDHQLSLEVCAEFADRLTRTTPEPTVMTKW